MFSRSNTFFNDPSQTYTNTFQFFFAYTLPPVEGIFQLFSCCLTRPMFRPHRYRSLLERSAIFTHELTIQSSGNTSALNLSLKTYPSSMNPSASFCPTFQHIAQNGMIFLVTIDYLSSPYHCQNRHIITIAPHWVANQSSLSSRAKRFDHFGEQPRISRRQKSEKKRTVPSSIHIGRLIKQSPSLDKARRDKLLWGYNWLRKKF